MTSPRDARQSLRIIFAGTPDFAAASLAALLDSQHQVVAVYCQPDRPSGRGRKLLAGPVKSLANEHDIPVLQPPSLRDENAQKTLRDFNADLMVVAAYGLILPEEVLQAPALGCINVHASLLPRWRGAAPIQHAILAGDSQTGITIVQMDAGLDTGAMLLREALDIVDSDTGSSLHDKLAVLGGTVLQKALDDLPSLQLSAQPQDNSLATYAGKITKQDAAVDWSREATTLERQIRAFNAWPVCYSELDGQRVRIWEARTGSSTEERPPGTIVDSSATGITVACGNGVLQLLRIQLPGARALAVADILNAHQDLFSCGNRFVIPAQTDE